MIKVHKAIEVSWHSVVGLQSHLMIFMLVRIRYHLDQKGCSDCKSKLTLTRDSNASILDYKCIKIKIGLCELEQQPLCFTFMIQPTPYHVPTYPWLGLVGTLDIVMFTADFRNNH